MFGCRGLEEQFRWRLCHFKAQLWGTVETAGSRSDWAEFED